MTTPVLVIGAGIAGLWTALRLAPRRVILLTGSPLGTGAATGWAQGGVAAALEPGDSPDAHARDTIAAGAGLVDAGAALALSEGIPGEIAALAALGAPFERDADGAWSLGLEAAHSAPRIARIAGDGAGAAILDVLVRAVRAAAHVEIREGWRAEALLPATGGGCAGVLARRPDGALERIPASDTVLATGGAGGLWAVTTTPPGALGQGLAMAAQLGATIADPEFMQFHPTAILTGADPAPLATEALRGEGAVLIDRAGRRLMRGVHGDGDLAPRDVVARAVHRAHAGGRGAFLDARGAIGADFPQRFPAVFAACMAAGIDPRREAIPVAPAAHYHMGGVATDLDGRTDTPGLWAVGECASNGLHGANRLASNSLAEGLVFGARAAKALLASAPVRRIAGPASPAPALPPLARLRLRLAMSREAGMVRTGAGLARLLARIAELQRRHGAAHELIAARFIALAATRREESRGGHFRADSPAPAPQAVHTRLRLDDLETPAPARPGVAEEA